MTNQTKLSILLITIFITTLAGCNSIKLDSAFTSNPIKIDGDYSDWQKIPALYFEDQKVSLALSNDADNLYIAFRFRDPKWLMAIHKTGLTIWLDHEAKKKEKFGIKYSGGPKPQDNIGFDRMRRNMPEGQNQFDNRVVDSTRQFVVLNSDWWYKEQNITVDGTFGPSVKYGFANDMYTYEFAVPLGEIDENYYGMGASPGKSISIGLEFGDTGMKRSGGMGGGRPGGGGGIPGGGMPGGGGMDGGRGGMGGRERAGNAMPEKQKIWIKTKLALSE